MCIAACVFATFISPALSIEIDGVNYTVPSGYTVLSYAESQNASTYLDISSLVTIATPITKLEVLADISLSQITTSRQFLFANGPNHKGHYVEVDSYGKFGLGVGQTTIRPVSANTNTVYHIHHVIKSTASKLYINDIESVSLSMFQSDVSVTPNTLFNLDNISSYAGLYVQIHNYVLKNNDTVLCVLVPMKNSDNVVGFYDFISKTFKTPSSGAFIAGPEVVIQVATTKYVEEQFAPISTELTSTIGTIETVVENTITQADRIEALHTGKQNRPDDYNASEKCPSGAKCLLISEADGTLHWYPICNGDGSIFDIATFLAQLTSNGNAYYYHGNDTTYREIKGNSTATTSTFQPGTNDGVRQLNETEWAVKWNGKGVVYGTSVCNSNSGTFAVASNTEQTEDKGQYCWCRMTNVAVADGTEYPSVGSWVFATDSGYADNCAYGCAYLCGRYVQTDSAFRAAGLGGGN